VDRRCRVLRGGSGDGIRSVHRAAPIVERQRRALRFGARGGCHDCDCFRLCRHRRRSARIWPGARLDIARSGRQRGAETFHPRVSRGAVGLPEIRIAPDRDECRVLLRQAHGRRNRITARNEGASLAGGLRGDDGFRDERRGFWLHRKYARSWNAGHGGAVHSVHRWRQDVGHNRAEIHSGPLYLSVYGSNARRERRHPARALSGANFKPSRRRRL